MVPSILSSDRGTHFTSEVLRLTLAQLGIKQFLHVPWRPQSSGVLERAHRSIKDALFITCKERGCDWVDALPTVLSCLNAQFNKSTGQVPFECVYGRKGVIGLPVFDKKYENTRTMQSDISFTLQQVHKAVRLANQKFDENYRAKCNSRPIRKAVEVGQKVCLYRPVSAQSSGKFHWIGRFTVLETNFSVCKVSDDSTGKTSWVHCMHIRPLIEREERLKNTDLPEEPVFVKVTTTTRPDPESQGGASRKTDSVSVQKVARSTRPPKSAPSAPTRQSTRARKTTAKFNVTSFKGQSYK